MPRYRTTGGLDDVSVMDGDEGFVGMDSRRPNWQLERGIVSFSGNGRIDGDWVPRKGVDVLTSELISNGSPLRMPFWLVNTTGGKAITAASRVTTTVTLTVPGHGLGGVGVIINGYPEISGFYTPKGIIDGECYYEMVFGGVTNTLFRSFIPFIGKHYWRIESPGIDPWGNPSTFVPFNSALSTVLPIEDATGWYMDLGIYPQWQITIIPVMTSHLSISGITGFTVDPNGVKSVTVIDDDTIKFTIPGATGSETYSIAGSDDKVASYIDDTSTEDVLGSCIFSDPDNANEEYAIIAFGLVAKKVSLATGSVTTINYPGSETIDSAVSMIQAFDRVILFRNGDAAMEWIPGASAFTLVPSGAYTQPQVLATGNVSSADGLVTMAVTGNATIAAGDMIRIYSSSDARFASIVGKEYEVKTASSTSITAYMPIADSASAASATQIGCNISVGGGFGHMPLPAWGQYFQRRLWVPYAYDPVTLAARGITDEIAVSDIMDGDTYDLIANQFRITGGIADHLVGMHPFYNDTMIVFNRNSIHSINGASGSLADASVNELTREVGCMARKSIITQGANVFFLSDNGVYGVGFVDQYNLRGIDRPLSQPIQPYIDRINVNLASDSVGIYFNNRYWLAVPLDSSPKMGDAIGNNAILVFNILNGAWESVDSYNDPSFLISNLMIGRAGARNDLYAVTKAGGVHIMDAIDADYDTIASATSNASGQTPISSVLTTRGYLAGTLERKRFTEIGITAKSGAAQSDFSIGMATDDPDSISSTVTIQDSFGDTLAANDTADVRVRAGGVRGQNGSVTITRRIGRPALRSVSLSGTVTNRSTISQK